MLQSPGYLALRHLVAVPRLPTDSVVETKTGSEVLAAGDSSRRPMPRRWRRAAGGRHLAPKTLETAWLQGFSPTELIRAWSVQCHEVMVDGGARSVLDLEQFR
jgi:hypothetical protein